MDFPSVVYQYLLRVIWFYYVAAFFTSPYMSYNDKVLDKILKSMSDTNALDNIFKRAYKSQPPILVKFMAFIMYIFILLVAYNTLIRYSLISAAPTMNSILTICGNLGLQSLLILLHVLLVHRYRNGKLVFTHFKVFIIQLGEVKLKYLYFTLFNVVVLHLILTIKYFGDN